MRNTSSVLQPSPVLSFHLHLHPAGSGQPWGLHLPDSVWEMGACTDLLRELHLCDVLSLASVPGSGIPRGDSMHRPVTVGGHSSTKTRARQGWQPPSPGAPGHRITEPQNSRGWKGPLWVLVVHLTASAQGERRNEGQTWPITWCTNIRGKKKRKENRPRLLLARRDRGETLSCLPSQPRLWAPPPASAAATHMPTLP